MTPSASCFPKLPVRSRLAFNEGTSRLLKSNLASPNASNIFDGVMGKPTFQLILDFARYCVRPFYLTIEERDVSLLVTELKLGVDEQLSGAQLKNFILEYHRRFAPTREFTAAMADEFADLVFEINRTFGGTLTKEALDVLRRDGLAPKTPRILEIK